MAGAEDFVVTRLAGTQVCKEDNSNPGEEWTGLLQPATGRRSLTFDDFLGQSRVKRNSNFR